MRGCWRPNVNFIFWPHCYDRHVESFSPDVGVNSIGAFREPPSVGWGFSYHISSLTLWESAGICIGGFPSAPFGRVWPSLPHLVSSCLEDCWQLHRGFSRSPSVGCGLPYHISSLTLWESAGICIGGFRGPPRSGVAVPSTSGLYCLEFDWQLLWGFSECPLGWVWLSLPHLVSSVWNSTGNCSGTQT